MSKLKKYGIKYLLTSFLQIIFFLSFIVSCKTNNEETCHIKDIKKFINLPDDYKIIECNHIIDLNIKSTHLKIKRSDVFNFLVKNKDFDSYKKYDENQVINLLSQHSIFYSNLKEDFDVIENFTLNNTYYFNIKDKNSGYISCLISTNGHLYIILE